MAWLEQREFFNIYLETVRDHPLYNIIQDELHRAFNNVVKPDISHYRVVSPSETFVLFRKSANPITVAFDSVLGSISRLSRSDTIYWTDENSKLGTYVYITYNETDFINLSNTYGNPGKKNLDFEQTMYRLIFVCFSALKVMINQIQLLMLNLNLVLGYQH